jgi:Uma2 family endonuclease
MTPPSDARAAVGVWLTTLVRVYVEERQLGEVRAGRSGVRISGTSLREPDLLFFQKSRLDQMAESGVRGAPDLAVEIVESVKARRQAVQKQVHYERIGVREYWVIDLRQREVRQWVLGEDGYRLVRLKPGAELVALTIQGLRLQVAWFFQGPAFPRVLAVVSELLEEAAG